MRAGLLNEVITIYSNKIEKDEYGYEKRTQTKKMKTRARVVHKSGNRSNENGEIVYSNFDTMSVRMYVPIESTDIIEWLGREYRVLYISPDRNRQEIDIDVELVNV